MDGKLASMHEQMVLAQKELYELKKILNTLYRTVDRVLVELVDFEAVGAEGADRSDPAYKKSAEFRYNLDFLCSNVDLLIASLMAMVSYRLTNKEHDAIKDALNVFETEIKSLSTSMKDYAEALGKGKVLYNEALKEQDIAFLNLYTESDPKTAISPRTYTDTALTISALCDELTSTDFESRVTAFLTKDSEYLALPQDYEVDIDTRLCYDLIYTDQGVIFPWPPKPVDTLLIFDLYVTRDSGSSAPVNIPGFNLSGSPNSYLPARRSASLVDGLDMLDNDYLQIEEVLIENAQKKPYKWQITGTTFNRMQMAIPRVIASIWGDQELYNEYAAIAESDSVEEGRKIIEIERKVFEEVNASSNGNVSNEWLRAKSAKIKKLKNRYLSKVYSLKHDLYELEIDFSIWLGILNDGILPEHDHGFLTLGDNKQLIQLLSKGEDGISEFEEFIAEQQDNWNRIVLSLARVRDKMKDISFQLDIWNVPEAVVLVKSIRNDLDFVKGYAGSIRENVDNELGVSRSRPNKRKIIPGQHAEVDQETSLQSASSVLEVLDKLIDASVDQTRSRLIEIASKLDSILASSADEIDFEPYSYEEKYERKFSRFLRTQAEISIPQGFNIAITPTKLNNFAGEAKEVMMTSSGLEMPFPLRPSLSEIYQSWAANESGIPTFTFSS